MATVHPANPESTVESASTNDGYGTNSNAPHTTEPYAVGHALPNPASEYIVLPQWEIEVFTTWHV